MIIEHKRYSAQCDKCQVNTETDYIIDWLPVTKITEKIQYTKSPRYYSFEELRKELRSYGWIIEGSDHTCICPKCNSSKTVIDLKSIDGNLLLESLSDNKKERLDTTYGFKYIFVKESIKDKMYHLDFYIEDDDVIRKSNNIRITKDGDVHMDLCEWYEGGDVEVEIEQLVRDYIIKLFNIK